VPAVSGLDPGQILLQGLPGGAEEAGPPGGAASRAVTKWGRHPHQDKVDIYFAGTLIAHTVVTHLLPKEWRPWWQAVTIGLEGSCVGWNFGGGVKVRF